MNKGCFFKKHDIKHVDYRDVHVLSLFTDQHGRILSRKRTGLSAQYHRNVTDAVKRARFMALIPYIK